MGSAKLRRRPTTSARRRTLDLFCDAGGIALGVPTLSFVKAQRRPPRFRLQ